MKRIFAFLLIFALLLPLAACGEDEKARPSSQASPSSSLETRSPSSEPQPGPGPEETSSQPDASQPDGEDAPLTGDALVREIIKTYGAEETTGQDGVTKLVPTAVSLFYRQSSWDYGEELSATDYFSWFLSTTFEEDPAYKEEHYAHPLGDGYGWFFPQDLFEERVQKYFQVSTEHLRGDSYCYDPELQGYWLGGGGGRGETPEITYTHSMEYSTLVIDLTLQYEYSDPAPGRLMVQLTGDGGWQYLGWQYRPDPLTPRGSSWADLDLPQEQKALVEQAEKIVRMFRVNTSAIMEGAEYTYTDNTKEIDGMTYVRYQGDRYQGWDDFYADMTSVVTPEFFQQLNRYKTFAQADGELYFLDGARGTNLYYLWDRFEAAPNQDPVFIHRYSYYADEAAMDPENATPTYFKETANTLVNTPDGWRVSKLTLPN